MLGKYRVGMIPSQLKEETGKLTDNYKQYNKRHPNSSLNVITEKRTEAYAQ